MSFNQGDITILNDGSLKLVDKFIYLGSSISPTESDIDMPLAKGYRSYGNLTCPIK